MTMKMRLKIKKIRSHVHKINGPKPSQDTNILNIKYNMHNASFMY